MTKIQRGALKALILHGSEGVMTNTGTMLAQGAELGHGTDGEGSRDEDNPIDFFQRSTWKALVDSGHIVEVSRRRYRVIKED